MLAKCRPGCLIRRFQRSQETIAEADPRTRMMMMMMMVVVMQLKAYDMLL